MQLSEDIKNGVKDGSMVLGAFRPEATLYLLVLPHTVLVLYIRGLHEV